MDLADGDFDIAQYLSNFPGAHESLPNNPPTTFPSGTDGGGMWQGIGGKVNGLFDSLDKIFGKGGPLEGFKVGATKGGKTFGFNTQGAADNQMNRELEDILKRYLGQGGAGDLSTTPQPQVMRNETTTTAPISATSPLRVGNTVPGASEMLSAMLASPRKVFL